MSALWDINNDYEQFNPQKHDIACVCDLGINRFIPYKRKYASLSYKQLLDLINDAKQYKWQALDLTSCGLSSLPDELWDLPDLRMLYLGNRQLFDESLKRESYINNDDFICLPKEIELLENLQVLSLQGVHWCIKENSPLELKKLIYLDIFNCGFKQIPKALLVPSIEQLGFNCMEEYLSEEVMSLRNLRNVYLSRSRFKELPPKFGELAYLKKLYLFGSNIESLPNSLRESKNLSNIEISKTPLSHKLPPEMLKQSAKEIVSYILTQQSNISKDYFNESKMVIVGQGHVGKTCLLNRLIHNTYTEEASTEGIDISSWEFSDGGQFYQLNVWDFGGQEIYHSTHQFFLTKRSLYLLVWDALAEDEYGRIDYWLKTIQSFADDSPIVIVVNKCDRDIGRYRRIDEKEYQERFPQIKDIIYVSCKDNIRIKELRKIVKSLAIKLPLMKTSWITSWMSVRKRLEEISKTKNYIKYSEYLDICKLEDIHSKEEALSLIKYLNDLGIVLYYYDDALLKNLVILSSEWGTDAVYKILDEQERKLKGRNGLLYTTDLSEIWKDEKRYPQDFYQHLLNLMEKFQLAFKINNSTYLVAELLDNTAIDLGWRFTRNETLSFRYVYDFLPAGVMTRFIVAINQFLETINSVKQCWRKGAYLRYRSAYALVRIFDSITDRYVQIDVNGDSSRDKRELLTKLRTAFEEINGQFSQIKITERIPCVCEENCDFLFDYETLLKAEKMGKATIECHRSLQSVSIASLLDGVESHMNLEYGNFGPQIVFSPNIINTANASASATNAISVTVEVRNWVVAFNGDFNDLKSEVGDQSKEFNIQCEKIEAALKKLENSQTDEEIKKSGVMNKIRRFLEECNDPDSNIGKLLAGVKYASGILLKLLVGYNKLADWLGLAKLTFGSI